MVYLLQQVALSCTLCHIDQPDSAFLPGSTLVCRAPRPVGEVPRLYKNNDAINCHGLKNPISAKQLLLKLE